MKNAFLIGQKVYLRPLEREDAPVLQEFINNPEIWRTLLMHRPVNRERELEFIENSSKTENWIQLGIVAKENDRLIGGTDLRIGDYRERKAEFGIMIGAKEEWNKGYGTEATTLLVRYGFATLNLNRIYLRVYADNTGARRAYEKAGFKLEGTLREDCYHEGRYWDAHVMGILRSEWNKIGM